MPTASQDAFRVGRLGISGVRVLQAGNQAQPPVLPAMKTPQSVAESPAVALGRESRTPSPGVPSRQACLRHRAILLTGQAVLWRVCPSGLSWRPRGHVFSHGTCEVPQVREKPRRRTGMWL